MLVNSPTKTNQNLTEPQLRATTNTTEKCERVIHKKTFGKQRSSKKNLRNPALNNLSD